MKVAIAGTNGLALCLARYLQHTFHSFILLTRSPNHPYATSYPMMTVSYSDENHLIYTLSGIDLVISMVTGNDQLLLIDSALKAGVSRFMPAEFGGLPDSRDRGRRLAQMRLRDHVDEGMQYTIIACGLLYERLGPGGLQNVGMGYVQGGNEEGDFLIDQDATRALLPCGRTGRPAMVCMTAMEDVARFIVAALELPNWPREFRLRGERVSVKEVVKLVEEVRAYQEIELVDRNATSLRSSLQRAEQSQDLAKQRRLSLLLAIAEGQYDYSSANMNDFVRLQPTPLRAWLQRTWGAGF